MYIIKVFKGIESFWKYNNETKQVHLFWKKGLKEGPEQIVNFIITLTNFLKSVITSFLLMVSCLRLNDATADDADDDADDDDDDDDDYDDGWLWW